MGSRRRSGSSCGCGRHSGRSAPDLIHSNGLKAHALAAVARPRGVPVLWLLLDFLSHRPVMARLLRRLTAGVAGGIAISEAVRRDAEAVLPGLAISMVLIAIETDHFAPADRDGAELDRLAGLELAGPGVVRVGLVATYANWKGQDVFLDALARLSATGSPVRGTDQEFSSSNEHLESNTTRVFFIVSFPRIDSKPSPSLSRCSRTRYDSRSP